MSAGKKFLCVAAALLLFSGSALAEFSPLFNQYENAYDQGETIQLTVNARLNAWQKWPKALPAAQKFLDHITLKVSTRKKKDQALSAMEVWQTDQPLIALHMKETDTETLTLMPSEKAAFVTRRDAPPAPLLMQDSLFSFPNFPAFLLCVRDALPLFAQMTEEAGAEIREEKEKETIKNVGKSTGSLHYTLTPEQLYEIYPRLLKETEPALHALYPDPAAAQKIKSLLNRLAFSDDLHFKRLLNEKGQDMGFRLTGRAATEYGERKIAVWGGISKDSGFYIQLSFPSVKGKDLFSWTASGDLTQKGDQRTWNLFSQKEEKKDGRRTSVTAEGKLSNLLFEKDEHMTGKITVTCSEDDVKHTVTLKPDFTLTDQGLSGSTDVSLKKEKKELCQGELLLKLEKAPPIIWPDVPQVDLRTAAKDTARQLMQEEQTILNRALFSLLNLLTPEERAQLTHALHTDEWMTAPAVPPLEYYFQSDWIVEEER